MHTIVFVSVHVSAARVCACYHSDRGVARTCDRSVSFLGFCFVMEGLGLFAHHVLSP